MKPQVVKSKGQCNGLTGQIRNLRKSFDHI